jgi:hypothetical protein
MFDFSLPRFSSRNGFTSKTHERDNAIASPNYSEVGRHRHRRKEVGMSLAWRMRR